MPDANSPYSLTDTKQEAAEKLGVTGTAGMDSEIASEVTKETESARARRGRSDGRSFRLTVGGADQMHSSRSANIGVRNG